MDRKLYEQLINSIRKGKHMDQHRGPQRRDIELSVLREIARKGSGDESLDVYATDAMPGPKKKKKKDY